MGLSILNSDDINLLLGPNYVPEGNYHVCLRDLTLNMTKDNDHHYIMANFEIIAGSFKGRIIKQIWSFRRGQEHRSSIRIDNYISKVTNEKIEATNDTVKQIFDFISNKLIGKYFVCWLIKDVDSRSELLYAESGLF